MVIGLRSSKEPPGRFLLCSIWDLRTIDRIPIGPRSDTDLSASHGIPPGIYTVSLFPAGVGSFLLTVYPRGDIPERGGNS